MENFLDGVLLTIGIIAIAYPLVRRSRPTHQAAPDPERKLRAEKENVYEVLKDLDFEFRTGKLSEQDYRELQADYRARALRLLQHSEDRQPDGECHACGRLNPSGSRYCEICGASLDPVSTCAACGAPGRPEDRFCAVCGHLKQVPAG